MRARIFSWETGVLALIVIAVAIPVALFGLSLVGFVVMPDELGYVKQAIAFGRGEPQTPGDFWFNSWAQLNPLLLAPFYKLFSTTTAFDLAHVMNAFLMASAAIPVWLLARRVLPWRPAALLVAALSVSIPWVGMAGTLMTEPVAYLASCWATLAMVNAVARPGGRSDLLALAALGLAFVARTQLIVLAPALVLAVLLHELLRNGGSLPACITRAWRNHRVLWLAVALAGVGVLVTNGLDDLLGNYIAPTQGALLPPGTLASARELLTYVVVGIGVLPLPLAAAWVATSLGRGVGADAHAFACVTVCVVPVLTIVGGAFTVGFTAGINDRYLFYVAPLLFTGMAAALLDRPRGSTIALLAAGAAACAIVAASALVQEGPSLVSPSMAFHVVLPGPDTIALVAGGAVAAIAVAARRVPERAMLAVVGGLVLAFCVVETRYTLREVSETQAGASDEFVRQRNWIDRALPKDARAASVVASFGDPVATTAVWWDTSFWNRAVERVYVLPDATRYDQGFVAELVIDPRTGRVPSLDSYRYVVRAAEDARFGLRGSRTVASHAGVSILEGERPYRAEWYMDSPDAPDGEIAPGSSVRIRVFPPGAAAVERVTVDIRARPIPGRRQSFEIRGAGAVRTGRLAPGSRTQVVLPLDLAGGPKDIVIRSGDAPAALRLLSVLPVQ